MADNLITKCQWCDRFLLLGQWQHAHPLFEQCFQITHGICPECKVEVLKEARKHEEKLGIP